MSRQEMSQYQRGWLHCYGLFFSLAWLCLKAAALVSKKLRSHMVERQVDSQIMAQLATARQGARTAVLCFCSSAGEYEQAKPLVDRWQEDASILVLLVFFSPSGLRYAQARGEKAAKILMPSDFPSFWLQLFRLLRPELTMVVRHELWPGFLAVAAANSQLWLVNGTEESIPGWWRHWLKARLLRFFSHIAVVSSADQHGFMQLGVPLAKIVVVGDTKFDRVLERAQQNQLPAARLSQNLNELFPGCQRLIAGSAWQPEVEMLLAAYQQLGAKGFARAWQLLLVPHDVSAAMVAWCESRCQAYGFSSLRFSHRSRHIPKPSELPPVLIIDEIGYLAELYGSAQLALVGGGLEGKVHNVLEPASYGLHIAHGPRFHNSREAVTLVADGLLTVVSTMEEAIAWWQRLAELQPLAPNIRLSARIKSLAGASSKLLQLLSRAVLS